MCHLQFFSNEKHTDKSRIIYGKLLPETYMWPIGLALWTMDTVLAKLFYRECLTGLSNPGSCVSYRGPCCARDLGSSSGARRKSRGRRLSGGDEKRRRNLKRWKIATIGDPENSRTRVRRTNFAAAKYPAVFPTETMYFLVREKHPRKRFTGVPVLIPSPRWCFRSDILHWRWFAKTGMRKTAVSFITEFLERRWICLEFDLLYFLVESDKLGFMLDEGDLLPRS